MVYEDAELVVVDKPPGLLTARVGTGEEGVLEILSRTLGRPRGRTRGAGGRAKPARSKPARPGGRALFVVHRLDREASGLLLFARSERALRWLKEELRARRIEREYVAVVEGRLATDRGVVASFLHDGPDGRAVSVPIAEFRGRTPGPDETARTETARAESTGRASAKRSRRGARHGGATEQARTGRQVGTTQRRGAADDETLGRLATTHYRVVERGPAATLLELALGSGRRHQIRVQLASEGHPIVGDARYGATSTETRLHLHARRLRFAHPGNGAWIDLESPLPARFRDALTRVRPRARVTRPRATNVRAETSWEPIADWFDGLVGERQHDHYRDLVLPGVLRLLEASSRDRVLDVACGQGALLCALAEGGVASVGIDAAPRLAEIARRRSRALAPTPEIHVADARALGSLSLGRFTRAACVLALSNLEPIEPVFDGVAASLVPGGAFVAVVSHPAFRIARQSSWGFESDRHGESDRHTGWRQYRRVDGYLSPAQARIVANPGAAARGEPAIETWTFHRPIQSYVAAATRAGFVIDRLEEWTSLRRSAPGPRAAEEDRARREIPLFLALRAIRAPMAPSPSPTEGA